MRLLQVKGSEYFLNALYRKRLMAVIFARVFVQSIKPGVPILVEPVFL